MGGQFYHVILEVILEDVKLDPLQIMENEQMAQLGNEGLIRKLYGAVNPKGLATIASYGNVETEWLDVSFNYHLAWRERHH